MSLAWVLLLTLVVFVEKVLPQGRRAAPVIGAGRRLERATPAGEMPR
jgi:predicted metal-binding membrane protein